MAVAVNTATWPAVEVLGHSFTPSLPAAISSRWAGKTERAAHGARARRSVLNLLRKSVAQRGARARARRSVLTLLRRAWRAPKSRCV